MANDKMDSRGRSRRMEKRWSCDMSVMEVKLLVMELVLAASSAMDD